MLCDYDCLSVFGGRRTNSRYIFSTTWHKNSVPFSTISFNFKGQKPTQVGFIPKRRFGSDDSKGKRKWVWLSVQLDPRPSTTSPEIASFFHFWALLFLVFFSLTAKLLPCGSKMAASRSGHPSGSLATPHGDWAWFPLAHFGSCDHLWANPGISDWPGCGLLRESGCRVAPPKHVPWDPLSSSGSPK